MSDPSEQMAPPLRPPISELRRQFGIYTPGELKQRCKELGSGSFLIGGLIPQRSLGIIAGDSGLGKSPLLYQAAICVAAGIPFLGRPVTQGPVLYLDFENGLGDVDELVSRLSRHLGLGSVPQDLLLWNYNDAPPKWHPHHFEYMLREAKPVWVIVDSLVAFAPDIEEKASHVTRVYQDFRKSVSECGTSITGVHHLRKPSSKPDEAPASLDDDPHRWFLQARGSRALINGCDVRLGVDHSGNAKQFEGFDGRSREIALVMGGFGRVRGKIDTTLVARVFDEDGEPVGYEKLAGVSLLFNLEQEELYRGFPEEFRFKDAQRFYGKGPQATNDFLKKCIGVGIMRKDGQGYRKVEITE